LAVAARSSIFSGSTLAIIGLPQGHPDTALFSTEKVGGI
jgi:hypothetical protein